MPKKNNGPTVLRVSSHFFINRNLHEAHEGPVTLEEQIKGLERFIRWHERQVQVGKVALGKILEERERRDAAAAAFGLQVGSEP